MEIVLYTQMEAKKLKPITTRQHLKVQGNLTEAELENRRLKRELKDTQDALEILKKPSAFWENNTKFLYCLVSEESKVDKRLFGELEC
ncbi:MAG: hypothetical protein ACLTTH_04320 [Holdemanella porci]